MVCLSGVELRVVGMSNPYGVAFSLVTGKPSNLTARPLELDSDWATIEEARSALKSFSSPTAAAARLASLEDKYGIVHQVGAPALVEIRYEGDRRIMQEVSN
jgi:predicted 3-demethylubiquinone-9 3-methyltransferase (glyoxalase superfamily)